MEKTAYCSLTYLFSFTAAELGLPNDATNDEIEAAAEKRMEKLIDYVAETSGIIHNDLEISVGAFV